MLLHVDYLADRRWRLLLPFSLTYHVHTLLPAPSPDGEALRLLIDISSSQWRRGKRGGRKGQLPIRNFSLLENFLRKSIGRKGIFILIFRKLAGLSSGQLYLSAFWSSISLCRLHTSSTQEVMSKCNVRIILSPGYS